MKNLYVYLYNNMAYWEISILLQLLTYDFKNKINVTSIRDKDDDLIRSSNIIYKADKILDDITTCNDIEGLIIPGGFHGNKKSLIYDFIRELDKQNKTIGAICGAPAMLAEANVLKDRKFTTSFNMEYFLKNNLHNSFDFSNYIDKGVVADKNIITAKPNYFIDFAVEYCSMLDLFDTNENKINTLNWFKAIK